MDYESRLNTLVARAQTLPADTEQKKNAVLVLADELRDDVLALERISSEIGPCVDRWIEAYRFIFTDETIVRDLNQENVRGLSVVNQTSVGTAIRMGADVFEDKRKQLMMFYGRQQAITRIVGRSAEAVKQIAANLIRVTEFATVEQPRLIESALASAEEARKADGA